MSKELELLQEALEWMHELKYVWANVLDSGDYDLLDLIAGINKIEKQLLAKPEQAVAECTNSDTWNCKYCNKTESCGALKDSRSFAPPTREKVLEMLNWHTV